MGVTTGKHYFTLTITLKTVRLYVENDHAACSKHQKYTLKHYHTQVGVRAMVESVVKKAKIYFKPITDKQLSFKTDWTDG